MIFLAALKYKINLAKGVEYPHVRRHIALNLFSLPYIFISFKDVY